MQFSPDYKRWCVGTGRVRKGAAGVRNRPVGDIRSQGRAQGRAGHLTKNGTSGRKGPPGNTNHACAQTGRALYLKLERQDSGWQTGKNLGMRPRILPPIILYNQVFRMRTPLFSEPPVENVCGQAAVLSRSKVKWANCAEAAARFTPISLPCAS